MCYKGGTILGELSRYVQRNALHRVYFIQYTVVDMLLGTYSKGCTLVSILYEYCGG